MSVGIVPQAGPTLSEAVAANVRAELARQRKTHRQLAVYLGLSPAALSRRTNDDLPFDVNELEATAAFLGVPLARLLDRGLAPSGGKVASDAQPLLRAVPSPRRVTLQPHSPRPLLRALSTPDTCNV